MKVVHIISGDIWAGAEVQVYQMVCALNNPPVKPLCILFNDSLLSDNLRKSGISIEIIDENRHNLFKIIVQCSRILKKVKPDIIHVHRNKEHTVGFFSNIFMCFQTPILRTVHGRNERVKSPPLLKFLRSYLKIWIDSILIKYFCDSIIAVSGEMFEYLQTRKPRGEIRQINNAIDPAKYTQFTSSTEIRTRFGVGDKIWIGTAARLVQAKNIPMLLNAAETLRKTIESPFMISIFGDGPLRASLVSAVEERNLSSIVSFHGFEKKILSVIASFDIFVLTSFHEGLPMALLEAMAMARPVICTAVGGMTEVIQNNSTGFLVDSNDHLALAKKLKLLIENPSLRTTVGKNAQKHIIQNYSIGILKENLIKFYTDILQD